MKKYVKSVKFITIICLCLIITRLNTNFSYAVNNTNEATITSELVNTSVGVDLNPIISAPIVDMNTPIRVSFNNTDVLSYSIETEGLTATEVTSGSMEYDIVATEEFGALDVYANYENDVVVKSSVYTYKKDNKVYVSDISKDQAWYNYIKEQLDLGEIAENVAQELYYELCGGYAEEYTPSSNEVLTNDTVSGKTIIQGKLFWQEDTTVVAPLIKANVQLIKKVNGITHIISSKYTNPDGSFRFEINNSSWDDNGEDIFIRWWLEAETFKVTNNWIFDHYCFQSSLKTDVSEGTVENFYYIIPQDEGLNHYKATFVHQAMTISERFAIAMGMPVPNYNSQSENRTKLNVAYPALISPKDNGYCFGDDFLSIAAIGELLYNDVDAITHEYGHYVQYLMNIYGANLIEIACNNPQHHSHQDHMLDNWEKEYAMELTWSEAWASVFSTVSEHYYWYKIDREYGYFDDNVNFYIYPKVGAMSQNSFTGANIETPSNSLYDHDEDSSTPKIDNRGEFQEATIEALLWDLYDPANESFDDIELGYSEWWKCTTRAGIYTLEDFTQYMENIHPELRNDMSKIMVTYKISPEISAIGNCDKDEAPTVTFVMNGSQEHPNNRFEILFYDTEGNLLGTTGIQSINIDHTTSYTYPVSDEVWESILDALNYSCDKEFDINIVVAGYRYDTTVVSDSSRSLSGPYLSYSMMASIGIKHSFTYVQQDSNYHKLICSTCGGEETELEHNFEYVSNGNNYHNKICTDCGYTERTKHNKSYEYISSSIHKEYCRDCNYVNSTASHDYTYDYEHYNTSKHRSYCVCGASTFNDHIYQTLVDGELMIDICILCDLYKGHEHSYTYLSAMDGKMHRKMCICGISQLELCFGTTFPGSTTSCVKCGQVLNGGTVTPFGDNNGTILFNKEDEEYLE